MVIQVSWVVALCVMVMSSSSTSSPGWRPRMKSAMRDLICACTFVSDTSASKRLLADTAARRAPRSSSCWASCQA